MLALNQFSGFLLRIYLLTIVQYVVWCHGCTLQEFKVSNLYDDSFDLSALKASYDSGDVVRVRCKVGFRGFFKLICSNDGWHNSGDKCRPISCGHPGDVQFADFSLVHGTDYVFGSQVQYTCHRGYQMTSYTSTRNCLQGGWDGHLPECEPVSCPPLTVTDRVLVSGDMDQPTSGSVLQFSCSSRDHVLIGAIRIECDDNGNWNDKPPICKEISCPKPQLDRFQAEADKMLYKKNEVFGYECDRGYKKVDGRPSRCTKVGHSAQWTPMPQCEVITCKLSPNPPVGTTYNPLNQIIFTSGQSVRVSCGEKQWVKDKEHQSADLTCQETGRWDSDPVCQLVTCFKTAENVYSWESSWESSWERRQTVDIDKTVWYQCHRGYEETSPTRRATCTRRGWEPNPLCKERRCTKPLYTNAEITHNHKEDKYEHNERVYLRCTYDPRVTFYVDCYYGNWRGSRPTCREKPCRIQPQIKNGEMVSDGKTEYEHGESLQFRCEGERTAFSVTCESGEWTTRKSCEDVACTEHPNMRNGEMVSKRKQRYQHGQTVEMRCTTGSEENFIISCQSGRWMSEHQCPEKAACGSPLIKNGFSHEQQNKLYYTCNEGYKLFLKGWWDVASCEEGKWKTSECVADTDCGPVPHIPNTSVTSNSQRFSEEDTFPIQCDTGHQNLHPDLEELTCIGGNWTSKNVPFEQICTPIANKCLPPPKVLNALIMDSFEEEYNSNVTLTYDCRDDFIMEGNSTIQCINGTWEQKSISCKAEASKPTVIVSTEQGQDVSGHTAPAVDAGSS